jgi:hypothetical protein
MVTVLRIQNYTTHQFNCTAYLDSEQEEICNFMSNVKSTIKPGYSVRVAQLTRDYLFYGGVSHYFSFHLSLTDYSKSGVLVLKVKNQDSDTAANLLFGLHALPYGSCTPQFKWHRSTAWTTSYWQFLGEVGELCCIEIKYRSVFTGGDSDLEFVFTSLALESKKFSQIKGDFLYDFTGMTRDLRIIQQAWHQETKRLFGRFTPTLQDYWMHSDGKKVFPIWNFYLPSPRWRLISGWKASAVAKKEEEGEGEGELERSNWLYSQRLKHTHWTSEPKSHPFAIRRRAYKRELLCKNFYPAPSAEDSVSLESLCSIGSFTAVDASVVERLKGFVGDSERFDWLIEQFKECPSSAIQDEVYIEQILKTFRFDNVKAKILQVFGVKSTLLRIKIRA